MELRVATERDAAALAAMNRQLIEDEGADTDRDPAFLADRMTGFLRGPYRAFLFVWEGRTIGYALCDLGASPVYLRQFFIVREERRQGLGRRAFEALRAQLAGSEIDLDVYDWNGAGMAFWRSLGFRPRFHRLRLGRRGTDCGV